MTKAKAKATAKPTDAASADKPADAAAAPTDDAKVDAKPAPKKAKLGPDERIDHLIATLRANGISLPKEIDEG